MGEKEHILFIYNPQAGKGTMKNKVSDVIEVFMKAGFEVTIYATMKAGEAVEIVKRCGSRYQRIICAGGDGTLHEVTYGLMGLLKKERPACGYIPTGTVNDFANGIKLPKRIVPAAGIAAGTHCHAYDIGEMKGETSAGDEERHFFTYVAAFGAFTSVSYETPQASKNLLGKTAYILDGVSKLNSLKSVRVKVTTDEEEWEDECILGMVTNAKSIGGIKNMFRKRKVRLDDGYFDGIFVRTPKNPIELNLVMNFLLTGEPNQQIYMTKSRVTTLQTETAVAYTLDGENGGTHKKVVITDHKQAITYFCGSEA